MLAFKLAVNVYSLPYSVVVAGTLKLIFICSFDFIVFSAIYLLYAKLEEEHGLARHAMAVYDRATQAVLPEEQNEVGKLIIETPHN